MTNAGQRDLKLQSCVLPWQNVQPTGIPLTTALVPVLKAYERNISRVHAFTMFAPAIVNTTKILTEVKAATIFDNHAKILAQQISEAEISAEIQERTDANADAREQTLRAGGKPAQNLLQSELKFGFSAMNDFLRGELLGAAEAWLSAQITGMWTAFEAMAEELWVSALNCHPRTLSELRGTKKGSGDDKKIDLSWLHRYDYDLSNKMGEVLRKKYNFDKLEEMKEAYEAAFSEDAQQIIAIISN